MSETPEQDRNLAAAGEPAAWTLARDVAVLQLKLLVDGLRDLVLVPASLVAGVISFVRRRNGQPGSEFYRLLAIGKQSEHWINLFGALDHAPVEAGSEPPARDIDEFLARFEDYVVDEYRRGGVTRQARERIEQVLESLRRRRG